MIYDVAVIGGGIVGCSIAAELAERGVSVVLLERDRIAAGASSAAAGMLAPQSEAHGPDAWFQLLLRARAEHEPLAHKLREETGIDTGYRKDGVLRVAISEGEREELRERAAWQRAAGLRAEWLEPAEARELEPALSPALQGALWCPDEAQVHSPRLTQALALLATRMGATIREGAPATSLESGAVCTPSERISVGAIVLAAGVWSGQIQANLPLEPVKGQIVSGILSPAAAPTKIVWGANAYMVPKADGQLLVGATEEPGNYDTRPTLGAMSRLIASAAHLVPSLRDMPLNTAWAGLRPALPDRKPALGQLGDRLFVAVGHYRNGILLGPLTGKIMADLVLEGRAHEDLSPYRPDRFALEPALTG